MKLTAPDTMPIVVAIDPGGTSGYAIYMDGNFSSGECDDRSAILRLVDSIVAEGRPVQLVVENYTITSRTAKLSPQPEALKLIGALESAADRLGLGFQGSQLGTKTFATDEKLRVLGWFRRTDGGHANDAARHLLTWMVKSLHPEGRTIAKALVSASVA